LSFNRLLIDNPASNHYMGSIDRLGRAFAEAKDRPKLEQDILAMIADNELDMLNRIRLRNLFVNYIYHLPPSDARQAAIRKLNVADKKLPYYIYSRLKINKEELVNGAGED
jgi:hypothetical protein